MLKAKVNKTKTKLVNEIDELKKKTQKQIDDSTKKTVNELARVELALKDTEKKTIWKINDCEALLQKRVTADYVDSTAKTLEEKLRREVIPSSPKIKFIFLFLKDLKGKRGKFR